jgi:hypothetical protein
MTRYQAKKIRARQLQGQPVDLASADLAAWRLSRVGNRRFVLPRLAGEVKAQANAALLRNLGAALGWSGAAA